MPKRSQSTNGTELNPTTMSVELVKSGVRSISKGWPRNIVTDVVRGGDTLVLVAAGTEEVGATGAVRLGIVGSGEEADTLDENGPETMTKTSGN